jgi:hypothetical protein
MNSAGTGWALPYYAQGTFTPVVTLTGAGTAPQYTTASGTYTRNGRTCFFNILLSGDGGNEGSGAGVITITLPFSTSADQLAITVQGGISNNGGTENLLYYVLSASSSTLTLKRQQSATQLTDFTGADQNNTTRSIQIMGKILV